MKRILFVVNHHVVIYNFRRELVETLLNQGHEVYVSSPYGKRINDLIQMGCKYIETDIRHGTNPLREIQLVARYRKILKAVKPHVMLTYTIKPNIYANIANQWINVPSLATITGLGTAVGSSGLGTKFLVHLYKWAFRYVHCVFFQNKDNLQFFEGNRIRLNKTKLVPGSGVNLEQHSFEEYPADDGTIRFLFVGRIMEDKGIEELVQAAKLVKELYPMVEFHAVGFYEDDYRDRARELEGLGLVHFHGVQDDVHSYMKNCHALVLPSYHEGMANVLLEAASTGRPVLASNIPGCRETFEEDVSGLGFEPRNAEDLARALLEFIRLPYEKKIEMGRAGRLKMEAI